jgi:hypothetical protein
MTILSCEKVRFGCLDMAQWRLLIGQSLCNAIYWSNMGFSVYWCNR